MPGYGILDEHGGTGLLPWSWAAERLASSHDYWLATVRPDGRPHVTPVWGVWLDDAVWFSSSGESRKARNLATNPQATITTDDALEPVVVEGEVTRLSGLEPITRFTEVVNRKYESDYGVDFFTANACFRLRPLRVFGLTEADFAGSPTRWVFPAGGAP
jgi:PPOX class probable F420-dependent enzyme